MHLLAVMASTLQDVARMDDGKGGVFVALVWPLFGPTLVI